MQSEPLFLMPVSRLERVAEAIKEAQRGPHGRLDPARAALEAMKYVDGADEDDLVDVSIRCKVEPVSLSEALDAYLDATIFADAPRALYAKEQSRDG